MKTKNNPEPLGHENKSSPCAEKEMLSAFIHSLSHNLRSPLSVSYGALNDLAEGYNLSHGEIRDGRNAARCISAVLDNLVAEVDKCARENEVDISLQLLKLMQVVALSPKDA